MDQVSIICRRRHYSRRTEEAYRFWIRKYIHFHLLKHPRDVGIDGVASFINFMAVERHVAASTQTQALNALVFLYRDVLGIEVTHIDKTYEGDAFAPTLSNQWQQSQKKDHVSSTGLNFSFITYTRRKGT